MRERTEERSRGQVASDPAHALNRPAAVQSADLTSADVAASDQLQLYEEVLQVSKREISTGRVRVSTHTEAREEIAEVDLTSTSVDVTRVTVGRVVDEVPHTRIEGDTTIVPVVEERFVVVRQLVLTEELHVRRQVETVRQQVPVQLRRQTAVIERIDTERNDLIEPDRNT